MSDIFAVLCAASFICGLAILWWLSASGGPFYYGYEFDGKGARAYLAKGKMPITSISQARVVSCRIVSVPALRQALKQPLVFGEMLALRYGSAVDRTNSWWGTEVLVIEKRMFLGLRFNYLLTPQDASAALGVMTQRIPERYSDRTERRNVRAIFVIGIFLCVFGAMSTVSLDPKFLQSPSAKKGDGKR
jgi:hypothetical protein